MTSPLSAQLKRGDTAAMPLWELAYENDDDYPNTFVAFHEDGPIEAATEAEALEKFKALTPATFDYYPCWIERAGASK